LRTERLLADDLEIYKVALAEPRRIESIAASTMSMGKPGSVKYIALPARLPGGSRAATSVPTKKTSSLLPGAVEGVAAAAAQITAREAQVLLASGSGLGGAR
jgi:hypothetical protein